MEDHVDNEMIDTSGSKANSVGVMDSRMVETIHMRDTWNKRNNKRERVQKLASTIQQIRPKFNYTRRQTSRIDEIRPIVFCAVSLSSELQNCRKLFYRVVVIKI